LNDAEQTFSPTECAHNVAALGFATNRCNKLLCHGEGDVCVYERVANFCKASLKIGRAHSPAAANTA
jgi:hypothetical protein